MNPVFTIAGAGPGAPEMTHWRTGMNPFPTANGRRICRGPVGTIAGMAPGAPSFPGWQTAYPNGESIYVAELRRTEAKALERKLRELPARRSGRRPLGKAA